MLNLNELNGGKRFTFDLGDQEIEYKKLNECGFDVAIVRSVYINRGGLYGDSATALVSFLKDGKVINEGVNLPKHQVKNIEKILDDDETINAINQLGLSIKPRKYRSTKYNKDCFTLEWVLTPKELKKAVQEVELPF